MRSGLCPLSSMRRVRLVAASLMVLSVLTTAGCALIGDDGRDPLPPAPPRADRGEHWNRKVDEFRAANPGEPRGAVVMIGDSITQNYPAAELFPDARVINRGISGDSVAGLIQRLDESVFDLRPRRIFIMIGVNDTLNPARTLADFRAEYEYLFAALRRGRPRARVFVQSVLPIRGQYASSNPMILQINEMLRSMARDYGFEYLDLQPLFRDEAGLMRAELAPDGVHPNRAGYELWADRIRPLMKQ